MRDALIEKREALVEAILELVCHDCDELTALAALTEAASLVAGSHALAIEIELPLTHEQAVARLMARSGWSKAKAEDGVAWAVKCHEENPLTPIPAERTRPVLVLVKNDGGDDA